MTWFVLQWCIWLWKAWKHVPWSYPAPHGAMIFFQLLNGWLCQLDSSNRFCTYAAASSFEGAGDGGFLGNI